MTFHKKQEFVGWVCRQTCVAFGLRWGVDPDPHPHSLPLRRQGLPWWPACCWRCCDGRGFWRWAGEEGVDPDLHLDSKGAAGKSLLHQVWLLNLELHLWKKHPYQSQSDHSNIIMEHQKDTMPFSGSFFHVLSNDVVWWFVPTATTTKYELHIWLLMKLNNSKSIWWYLFLCFIWFERSLVPLKGVREKRRNRKYINLKMYDA